VFALRTTSIKADAFPVSLYVILAYDGGLDDSYGLSEQTPQENFVQQTKPKGSFTYCALTNNMILDSSQYKYNPEVGYYCKYDSVLGEFEYYDEAKTQPILLYVKITSACQVLDLSFIGVDPDTGSYLSMHCNGKNYDSFFRYVDENGAMYTETDPVTQVTTLQKGGYSLYVNSDGCYPVTQELKEFLTDFNISQRLFNDGNGEAESRGYKSAEGDQWLFACGIYVR
jgi:hypothetical protein